MTPADVERVLRVLRSQRDEHLKSDDRFEKGMGAGLGIAVRALRELIEEAAA